MTDSQPPLPKENLANDWRAQNAGFLRGAKLQFARYTRWNETWDHDQCAGCWATFAEFEGNAIQHEGYTTCADYAKGPRYEWVCPECFNDLHQYMEWTVIDSCEADCMKSAFAADTPIVSLVVPSANFGERSLDGHPEILLLHYTGMPSAKEAILWLATPESGVSCHYVVDEIGTVTQMVPEAYRAWHAGVSHWRGQTDINSRSIGIEIHNPGHDLGYPDFPGVQMAAVEALCLDIIKRHGIEPRNVLAHSDVAPRRKIDPGEKFDWARLARAGIGHWTGPFPIVDGAVLARGCSGAGVARLQENLLSYGYHIAITGDYCEDTKFVVAAFQRHFRPALVDGRADRSTVATLEALLAALPGAQRR
jgi:N-acetylmuramoyl-L-alanine amidase